MGGDKGSKTRMESFGRRFLEMVKREEEVKSSLSRAMITQ